MAKRFVKISLATKFRLLFGVAVLGIIAAALVVPWYFMELLAEQDLQRRGAELTRLRLNEWREEHAKNPVAATDSHSKIISYSSGGQADVLAGPFFIKLKMDASADRPLDVAARRALKTFIHNPTQKLALIEAEDEQARPTYRCFRAARIEPTCTRCHGASEPLHLQFQSGQLVGMIDVAMPAAAATQPLVWWTRGAFAVGAALAGLVAFILFAIITQRLVLRPVRRLRNLAEKVAEGDLSARSTVRTGDELQLLGDSFNEMLTAITEKHNQLRLANRALDLKLNELAEVNVTLFQANQVKSEFLANISHELRTPLNSIIGFADLLGSSQDQRTRRYGENITQAARNLLNMINALLDLAKIEAGKAEVRFDKVSITDTCQTLIGLMKPLADKKQLDLRAELTEELPLVITDAGKLQQILFNLLSNAIKFTPTGGQVTVSTTRSTDQRGGKTIDEVVLAVTDTGPGIAEADQQNIFEKFYQSDRGPTKESAGTGLGLAIAKELTNLLGGRLTLKSSPGHGATFTVFLPVNADQNAPPARQADNA